MFRRSEVTAGPKPMGPTNGSVKSKGDGLLVGAYLISWPGSVAVIADKREVNSSAQVRLAMAMN